MSEKSTNDSSFFFESNTYANLFTFIGLPLSRDISDPTVDAVVMGIPFDLGTSGRSGTRHGPNGVRQASAHLRWQDKRWPWRFELGNKLKVIDYGDLCYADGYADKMMETVVEHVSRIIAAGKTLLSIGGDHMVTLPLLRAHAQAYGKLALLHFDAHPDNENGDEYDHHGTMFYHAPREGLIDPAKCVQVGIRTQYDYDNHEFTVLDAQWVNNESARTVLERIHQLIGDTPVYLSFDIDCLDPAFAPGTGTPVIGGLSSAHALQILHGLQGLNIVGMDVVEVAPVYDHADITSLAAATLALEMLYVIAANRQTQGAVKHTT